MKNYFVIFPHAGAIRSSYALIESKVSKDNNVVYVDYSKFYEQGNCEDFSDLLREVTLYLQKTLINRNVEVFFFAHSMGGFILQALENTLTRTYYIKKLIYSDCLDLESCQCIHLKDKPQEQLEELIREEYDLPEEMYEQKELLSYFQKKLLDDLLIIDTIPECRNRIVKQETKEVVQRLFICSDYIEKGLFEKTWNAAFGGDKVQQFMFIAGNHYTILREFEAEKILSE